MTTKPTKKFWNAYAALYGEQKITQSITAEIKKPKHKAATIVPEWRLQASLVSWARSQGLILISIPNAGKQSLWAAQREKAMGLTPSVSDLLLCHQNSNYGAYWIEMKAKGKKPTPLQYEWMEKMRAQGYKADWFDCWLVAKEAIEKYMTDDRRCL